MFNSRIYKTLEALSGGESGIRTHETAHHGLLDFESYNLYLI